MIHVKIQFFIREITFEPGLIKTSCILNPFYQDNRSDNRSEHRDRGGRSSPTHGKPRDFDRRPKTKEPAAEDSGEEWGDKEDAGKGKPAARGTKESKKGNSSDEGW